MEEPWERTEEEFRKRDEHTGKGPDSWNQGEYVCVCQGAAVDRLCFLEKASSHGCFILFS